LEFDDSELTQIAPELSDDANCLFEDEEYDSNDFNSQEEKPAKIANLTNLDADNYEEQLKPSDMELNEDAIRFGNKKNYSCEIIVVNS
jgi:hypothetical protein